MSLLRGVNIHDANGVSFIADKSGGLRVNSEVQSAVHDGNMFSFTSHGTITAGSSIILLGRTGAKQVHFDGFNMDISQGAFLVEMFEAPTVTTTGSLQTSVNRNRVSTTTATMSLYAGATVSANGGLVINAVASVNGTATVTADGSRITFASGSIDGTATVTADGIRIQTATASILGEADVTALGGVEYSANAAIEANADVVCMPIMIWDGDSNILVRATLVADGNVIGDEWDQVTEDTNTWTVVSGGSNIWTEVASQSNTWTRQ